jgi:peptidyl-prolyl cis-trans isomerase SurA
MKSLRGNMRPALVAAILVAGSFGLARADVIEQILVKVNGEIFTKSDLEARQATVIRQQLGQQADPKAGPSDAELRKMLDEVTPDLIAGVVDEILIVQRGKELGYTLSEEEFQRVLDSIKRDNKFETTEEFEAAVKAEGLTMADLRRNLERQKIIQQVQQNEVLGRIAVTQDEARKYYDAHVSEFTTPQAITLREIFISVPGDVSTLNVGLDEEAREKANVIRARAANGESFEKLASELSNAPSRANAGLIGPFSLSDLAPDLRKLIESMKPGEISAPLRTPRGYQILKLESSSAAQTLPFEQAREQISERVFTDKRRVEFEKYLQRLRSEATIELKDPEIKKAYDLGLERLKRGASAAAAAP